MYLTRQFAPAIAGICLLITLFALAVVSVGDSSGKVSTQRGRIRTTGANEKRDGALISFPWTWRRSAKDAKGVAHDSVVTITVCTAIDSLPTAANNSPTTLSAVVQNSGLADASSIHMGASDASPSNGAPSTVGPGYGNITNGSPSNEGPNSAAASNPTLIPNVSTYNNSRSAVPSCDQISSLSGTACQYYPPTVYPTGCSGCVRTSTVIDTYFSTISSCNATQINFISAFTITVTANLSTSVTPLFANRSLAVTPSKSIKKIPNLSLPTGNFSLSSIVCANETLATSPQDCVLSLATIASNPSSPTSQITTTFGSVPNSPGSALASQTPRGSILSAGNPKNSITADQGESSATASYINNIVTGTAFITSLVSNGGSSEPVLPLNNVSSFVSVPTIFLQSGSLVEPPPSSATNDPYVTSSIDLASVVSAGSLLSSSASIVHSPISLPTSVGTTTQGLVSSLAIILSSRTSLGFPVVTASTSTSTTVSSNIEFVPSFGISSINSQALFPITLNGATAVLSTASPIITGFQGVISSVDSVADSIIPEISSAQMLISSDVSDVTVVASSVLLIASSASAIINSILNTIDSFGSSLLAPITASHSLIPSIASSATTAVLPLTTSIPTLFSNVPSSINLATTLRLNSGQDLISSIFSDATDVVLPLTTSIPSVLQGVLGSLIPVVTSAINSVQSLTPSIVGDITAISVPLKSSATGLVNGVLTSGNPIVASSVPTIANSAVNNVNSISFSIAPPLHSSPVEVNGGGTILASIANSAISTIPSIVDAIPNVLGGAFGGNLARYDVSFITTVTKVVSVVKNFTHSTVSASTG